MSTRMIPDSSAFPAAFVRSALEGGDCMIADRGFGCSTSEIILKRELNLSHIRPCRCNLSKTRHRGLIGTAPARIRRAPLHMVRSVEHFHTELQTLFFDNPEVLDRREIEVNLLRPPQIVARTISELRGHGVVKGCRIKVEVGSS